VPRKEKTQTRKLPFRGQVEGRKANRETNISSGTKERDTKERDKNKDPLRFRRRLKKQRSYLKSRNSIRQKILVTYNKNNSWKIKRRADFLSDKVISDDWGEQDFIQHKTRKRFGWDDAKKNALEKGNVCLFKE